MGTDLRGLVDHVRATLPAAADVTRLPALLHGREQLHHGRQTYWTEEHRRVWTLRGAQYRARRRGALTYALTRRQRRQNRERSRQRARGEQAFLVIKALLGFTKVRYRGLHKNLVRAYAMFAPANPYLVLWPLLPAGPRPASPHTCGAGAHLDAHRGPLRDAIGRPPRLPIATFNA